MENNRSFQKSIAQLRQELDNFKQSVSSEHETLVPDLDRIAGDLTKIEDKISASPTPWERVLIARSFSRPTTLDYIRMLCTDFIECHGDRLFADDTAIVGGIARFHGRPVTVIGEQRGRNTKENLERNFGMPHPEGYRKALRLMRQAEKFRRPIITFIDTKGAYPGSAAEARGQSEAIAKNLYEMSGMAVPIISVVIGEGASGGALAISVANKILMLENAWYSVISPEGAAAILWRDAKFAEKAAQMMSITAAELKTLGIIDQIVPEIEGGADRDPQKQADYLDAALRETLAALDELSPEALREQRLDKFLSIGKFKEADPV
ncbi:MAG: acetyl-CoA carboxylase carboxyltransferase subunit alpha [Sporolactobacillus sp.]